MPLPDFRNDPTQARPATGRDSWCLFLDVDGTLLEFASAPDAVHVDGALRSLLLQVARTLEGAVALVSGRAIAEIDRLFAPPQWPAAGLHGLERRDARGHLCRHATRSERLDKARLELLRLANRTPGVLLEDKGESIAVHFPSHPQETLTLHVHIGSKVIPYTVMESMHADELRGKRYVHLDGETGYKNRSGGEPY